MAISEDNRPIVLLGGTFDPVHYGHLRLAVESGEELQAKEVRMLVSSLPPHRQTKATALQRFEMLKRACLGSQMLVPDSTEIRRSGSSYTIDTVEQVRIEVGWDVPLCLVIGQDAFSGFLFWRRWQELFDFVHVIIATRPGYDENWPVLIRREWKKRAVANRPSLLACPYGKMMSLSIPPLDISSSRIRHLLALGRSVQYLLPEEVRKYIEEQRLYGDFL
ncbi:MAG: nicotinate-nucleotide adenylyltransferase [Proteobacteria bacterium]|nr:nicotinate-nucleotide adenylyltransferase [Pseudomonadota bacterium]MDE3208174.1 nicotinate-nucleotide adenylyltransferase [Pseudomonadota bacterium]